MVNLTEQHVQSFEPAHASFSKYVSKGFPKWLLEGHNVAYDYFLQRGLPTLRDEEWKYTNVRFLANQNFGIAQQVNSKDVTDFSAGGVNIVFVNGVLWSEGLDASSLISGARIRSLKEIATTDESLLAKLVEAVKIDDWNPFSALNQAFLSEGVLIEVLENQCVGRITVQHIFTDGAELSCFPKIFIHMKKNAEATLVERISVEEQNGYFMSPFLSASLEPNARLSHQRFAQDGRAACHVSTEEVHIQRDAFFEYNGVFAGGKVSRHHITVHLDGPNAEADLSGVTLASGEEHVDLHIAVNHNAPQSRSRQLFKGVIDDKARLVFDGKVRVAKGAVQSSAQQLSKNLLLSTDAEVDAKPQLEIDTDDVKCSHGSTVGQLDPDELFYLLSRGIPRTQATNMLQHAFVAEVLDKISEPQIRGLAAELFKDVNL
ncbi:MAG: Fe-S cluster assembly protein SufD [Oligoflexales bacterium]